MTWTQSLVLALLQGITELFPISSLGHTVVAAALLGWGNLVVSPSFVPFLVLFHVGTAAALFIYFWRDWVAIIRGFIVTAVAGRLDADRNGRLAWLLIVGTVPAGLIGLFLENPLKSLFATPLVAAAFLALNGVVLLVGERARRRALASEPREPREPRGVPPDPRTTHGVGLLTLAPEQTSSEADSAYRPFETLTWREAVLIGLAQALALIPGISRSGVTMVAALRVGMNHEEAATYTFLLATPIIAAAGVLEIPQLFGMGSATLLPALVGGVVAAVAAYLSTTFLMRYFEKGRLDPFGYYCIIVGLLSFAFLAIHG
ncbi:MAG: undecaprenyl-diphosphate phosphatase [Chloroflexi bacterium]|nr:undecaprenyl-diphosphate phosphatase [Chloroflexota bacterium]